MVDGESVPEPLLRWRQLTLRFSETVSWAERDPGNSDTRPLAFLCFELTLLDDAGGIVASYDVGNDAPLLFNHGVFPPGSYQGETGRWFGGEAAETTLSLPHTVLEVADRLRLRGIPMSDRINMTLLVSGEQADTVRFESTHPQTLTLSIADF